MTTDARPRPRARRRWLLRLLAVGFALAFALLAVELLLHLAPGLLPSWFRERYPPHGIEFFHRGVLDDTSLLAVPLPYGVQPFDGPPPHDIADFGVAPAEATALDRASAPRLVVPADFEGLPNAERPAQPDLVLVGDSFTVFAAQRDPPGLQLQLEQDLGARALNLGISGIGPDHELWLLENRGLPAKPRVVVWLFYAGNDVVDAFWLRFNMAQGPQTYGELFADRRAPRLIVPSLLAALFASAPELPCKTPEPGFALRSDAARRLWFYPDTLRLLSQSQELLLGNPGWTGVTECLRRAQAATAKAGARFVVVYLPCKEQVYLPLVAPDPEQLWRTTETSRLYGLPMPADAMALQQALLDHRAVIETALQAFCEREHIAFWSATPAMAAAAAAGEVLFYATDTHWNLAGQTAVAPGLARRLREADLLGR